MAITAPIKLMAWEQNLVRLRTVQGEDQSRVISAEIYQWGNFPLDMTGYTASVYITERSGRKVTEPAEIDGNTVTATIPYLSSDGDADVQICLVKSESEMLKIVGLTLDVAPSDLEGAAEASDEFNDLAAATVAANAAAALATQVAEDIQERADSGEFDGASGTIDSTTDSPLTGLLKGSGGKVTTATAGTDYIAGNDYAHPLAAGTTTGTASAFVLTLNPPLTAYVPGMMLSVNFHTSSSTAPTLNINGLGEKSMTVTGASVPTSLSAGRHTIQYDGTYWRVLDTCYLPCAGGTMYGELKPYGTSVNLGSSGARWQTVFANTINASNGGFTNLMVNSQSVWSNAGIVSQPVTISGGTQTSVYTIMLYKVGRLVIVTNGPSTEWMDFGNLEKNTQLGTLPSGFWPANNMSIPLIDPMNNATIRFMGDGRILANTEAVNQYCGYLCSTAYLTA